MRWPGGWSLVASNKPALGKLGELVKVMGVPLVTKVLGRGSYSGSVFQYSAFFQLLKSFNTSGGVQMKN